MLMILNNIWILTVLVFGMSGLFISGFVLGIMYTQMEEDEYENGTLSEKFVMRIGKKVMDFWF